MNGIEGLGGGYFRPPGAERVAERVVSRLDGDKSGGLTTAEIEGSRLEKRIGDRFGDVDVDQSGEISKRELSEFIAAERGNSAVAPGRSQVGAVLENILAELQNISTKLEVTSPEAAPADEGGTVEEVEQIAQVSDTEANVAARVEETETAEAAPVEGDETDGGTDVRADAGTAATTPEDGTATRTDTSRITDLAQTLYSDVQTLFDEVT